MPTNKKIGNDFETEFCEMLADRGFWVHNMAMNKSGQPADVIAVKDHIAHLIDCKVVSTNKGFRLNRVEDNQELSMSLWKNCNNGHGWFAIKLPSGEIFLLSHYIVKIFKKSNKASISEKDLERYGLTFERWVKYFADFD